MIIVVTTFTKPERQYSVPERKYHSNHYPDYGIHHYQARYAFEVARIVNIMYDYNCESSPFGIRKVVLPFVSTRSKAQTQCPIKYYTQYIISNKLVVAVLN